MLKLLIFLLVSCAAVSAFASESVIATYPMNLNGYSVPVRVARFPAAAQPAAGTVVYLCGGPAVCIDSRPSIVPAWYDVVVTDYIGLGLNTLGPAPPELMTIEMQGLLISQVVRALALDRYLIYGQSFGTVIATVAAATISRDISLSQPQSVILEGTVGLSHQKQLKGYRDTSERIMQMFTPEERARFKNAVRETKAAVFLPGAEESIDDFLYTALWDGPTFAKAALLRWTASSVLDRLIAVNGKPTGGQENSLSWERMYKSAACQIVPKYIDRHPSTLYRRLIKHPLVASETCTHRLIERNYDSRNFQITAPILYINGEFDPATPMDGVFYHIKNQNRSKLKVLIPVKDGGHFNTWHELAPCASEIFTVAMSGQLNQLSGPQDFAVNCAPRAKAIVPKLEDKSLWKAKTAWPVSKTSALMPSGFSGP